MYLVAQVIDVVRSTCNRNYFTLGCTCPVLPDWPVCLLAGIFVGAFYLQRTDICMNVGKTAFVQS
jgi:hypothetical protein